MSVAVCGFFFVFFKCDSLERQTLDHDSLAAVFFGHFDSRTSLYSFILPHTHQHNIYTDVMVTKRQRK